MVRSVASRGAGYSVKVQGCFAEDHLPHLERCVSGQTLFVMGRLETWPTRVFVRVQEVAALPGANDAQPVVLNHVLITGTLVRRPEPMQRRVGDRELWYAVLPVRPAGSPQGELGCFITEGQVRALWDPTGIAQLCMIGHLALWKQALVVDVRQFYAIRSYDTL
jgi:hypothetical protein